MRVEFYTFENLEDVWVKSWEQRDGLAVCSAVDVNLVTNFNPEEYYRSDVLMYRTGDKNLFVVNTEHNLDLILVDQMYALLVKILRIASLGVKWCLSQ